MELLRAETILPVWAQNCLARPNKLESLGRTIMLVTEGLNEIERKWGRSIFNNNDNPFGDCFFSSVP